MRSRQLPVNDTAIICVSLSMICRSSRVSSVPTTNSTRTINGQVTDEGQFSYVASLRDPKNQHVCGTILLSARWLVTTAHCINHRPAAYYRVATGSTSKTGGILYKVARIEQHHEYEQKTRYRDRQIDKENLVNTWVQFQCLGTSSIMARRPCSPIGVDRTWRN